MGGLEDYFYDRCDRAERVRRVKWLAFGRSDVRLWLLCGEGVFSLKFAFWIKVYGVTDNSI